LPHVESIHLNQRKAAPLVAVEAVEAVAGRGLVGDRRFEEVEKTAKKPGRQVTLIEAEAIEALARDYGHALGAGESRRNIVTRGVSLNHLVGREFKVGAATLRGLKLCEPCGHLAKPTALVVRRGLVHRGGLNAEILAGGEIRVGDPVVVEAGAT
jgi:MOSC domain-containing protein YiiM